MLFAPIASSELSGLETDLPIVYASDATMKLLVETYGYEMTPEVRQVNERVERSAIERAKLLLYSSHWAAESAMADYGAKPDKIPTDVAAQFADVDVDGGDTLIAFGWAMAEDLEKLL